MMYNMYLHDVRYDISVWMLIEKCYKCLSLPAMNKLLAHSSIHPNYPNTVQTEIIIDNEREREREREKEKERKVEKEELKISNENDLS